MRSRTLRAVRVLGAMLLVAVFILCVYGFLASFEAGFPSFPNAFHLFYGSIGVGAVIGAMRLLAPVCKGM